ncbi:MAG: hypothetical protein HOQ24_18100 [Mycobacteriaceae bacterium]|nr:hypothetical protein [Mycobacteriaceae bacterium]
MDRVLEESFFFYRHKCRFDVQVDTQEQRIVLPVGAIGAITLPVDLIELAPKPVIRRPDEDRCTVLTDGMLRITKGYLAAMRRRGVTIVEPGTWIVLPMHDNDPAVPWRWEPAPLQENPTLPRPSEIFAGLN